MRVGVLGTGNVGQTLASKLISLGEQVMMGARQSGNEKAVARAKEAGPLVLLEVTQLSNAQEKGGSMLVLKITMMRGRTPEQKEALIAQLSQAAAKHLDWPLEEVRVAIYEIGEYEWGIGGRSVAVRRTDAQSH